MFLDYLDYGKENSVKQLPDNGADKIYKGVALCVSREIRYTSHKVKYY